MPYKRDIASTLTTAGDVEAKRQYSIRLDRQGRFGICMKWRPVFLSMSSVKRIQKLSSIELEGNFSPAASWHEDYRHSAYIHVGGIPYELSEGDIITIFSQYGTLVDCHLVRDKTTGKSKGFAFLGYEDQRSTDLAVDNLNGIKVLGRLLKVDHCNEYKRPEIMKRERELARADRGQADGFHESQQAKLEPFVSLQDRLADMRKIDDVPVSATASRRQLTPQEKELEILEKKIAKKIKSLDPNDPMRDSIIAKCNEKLANERRRLLLM